MDADRHAGGEPGCHHPPTVNIQGSPSDLPKEERLGNEKRLAAKEEAEKLLSVGFIREARYTTWLANVVMVTKPNGNWRMCVDYRNINSACPRDTYPLPNIDRLVDRAADHKIMSFLDAYSGYNQISMHRGTRRKRSS